MTSSNRRLDFRIADTQKEFDQVYALRHEVFAKEVHVADKLNFSDRDEYDDYCDHLIVYDIDQDSKIVGTYRILRRDIAKQHKGFYSETQFDLKNIYNISEEIAEIGRSCVHSQYRDGSVIRRLWHGLMQYMKDYNLKYLCGSGSVQGKDRSTLLFLWHYLKDNDAFINEEKAGFFVRPKKNHQIEHWANIMQSSVDEKEKKSNRKSIPPLIKGYTRAKAKFFPQPAFDPIFNTTDFFIAFDIADVEKRYGKHFIDNK